jgi:hypothetical protein
MKIHFRHTRLFINGGIRFPICYAYADVLDMNKTALKTTGDYEKITCKHCQRIYRERYDYKKRNVWIKHEILDVNESNCEV